MKGIRNKAARRLYGRMARRFFLWHDSQSTTFAKKTANRRVAHTPVDSIMNGASYKSLMDLRFVRED